MGLARFLFPVHKLHHGGGKMDQKQMMQELQRNPQLLQKLAQSRDGQMLMSRLQQNGQALDQAAQRDSRATCLP